MIEDALSTKYIGANRDGEEWVLIFEARDGAGYSASGRRADLIAINTWPSKGLRVEGHEIKRSRSDWVKEMSQPDKAEHFMRWCDRWWLVVPKPHAKIVHPGELPPNWGLMEVADNGRVRTVKSAPTLERADIPWGVIVSWFAGVDREAKNRFKLEVNVVASARVTEAVERVERDIERRAERVAAHRISQLETKLERLTLISDAIAGTPLERYGADDLRRWIELTRLHGMGRKGVDAIRLAAKELAAAVEILDALEEPCGN